jgi:hypothetical protein
VGGGAPPDEREIARRDLMKKKGKKDDMKKGGKKGK